MAAKPYTSYATERSRTSAPHAPGRAREAGRPRAFDHYIHRGNSTTDRRSAPTPPGDERSPLAVAQAAQLERRVAALAGRRRTLYERYVKPVIDWLIAAVMFVLLLPVLAMTALAVWITLGSPVLLRQPRIGRDGETFGMLKFRTMRPDRRKWQDPNYRGPERRVNHKSPNDPRHTPLGRKLRKTSLDELPQLLNVLRGDMSLVGPRPELVEIVTDYRDWQHARHAVKPGITGLWQVTERPNGGLMHEHTELDLDYIEQLSFRSDLGIVIKTPFAVLRKDEVV